MTANKKPLGRSKRKYGINIIDSPPGSGKSSWAIKKMSDMRDINRRYIYITPFLNEITRVKESIPERKFTEPKINKKSKTKLESLKQLIIKDKDIATTHALFTICDQELIELLKSHDYTLILDEVIDVVSPAKNFTNYDIDMILNSGLVEIDKEQYGRCKWLGDENYVGKFSDLKQLCDSGTLYYANNTFLVWVMPIESFQAFDEIFILTYQFQYQIQSYYYDFFEMWYDYYHIEQIKGEYTLVKTKEEEINTYDIEFRKRAKELISIIDNDKLNGIGDEETNLSVTWYKKRSNASISQLKNNVYNFFRHISDTKSEDNMWTTFKDYKNTLKGKGYTKGFVPCNSRATNEFGHKKTLAYLCNRYPDPSINAFFQQRGYTICRDNWALSELLQWIWRSAIRNGESVTIYIPSARMRRMLKDWLDV